MSIMNGDRGHKLTQCGARVRRGLTDNGEEKLTEEAHINVTNNNNDNKKKNRGAVEEQKQEELSKQARKIMAKEEERGMC